MYDVSLIIPVYNEEENIIFLFESIKNSGLYEQIEEVIIIDDCSIDNTSALLSEINSKYIKFKFYKNTKNMGQSYSIKKGAELSICKTIITMDGDGQNNPLDGVKLLKIYHNDPDLYLVGGIRKDRKDSILKKLASLVANKVRKKILDDECDDTGCALKVFDKDQFLKFPYFNGIHRFLPALFKGYNKKTYFVEVSHKERAYGKSKYGILDRLFIGIIDIFKVRKIIRTFKNE